MPHTCKACDGKCMVETSKGVLQTCPVCHGTGEHIPVEVQPQPRPMPQPPYSNPAPDETVKSATVFPGVVAVEDEIKK